MSQSALPAWQDPDVSRGDDQAGEVPARLGTILAARLNAIREPRMRVAAIAEALASSSAEAAIWSLATWLAGAGDAASSHRIALDAALVVLGDSARLAYDRRTELYAAARAAELPEVAMLLIEAAPVPPGTERLERELDDERPLIPSGRPLTLGERKAMARGHRRDLLGHLLRDPHPDVVAILLDNPRLTESDVVRLAARRPMVPAALGLIAASERWRNRSQVRRALVHNPFTPLPLAARVLTTLSDRELRDLAADGTMAAALRLHARAVLARRRIGVGQVEPAAR